MVKTQVHITENQNKTLSEMASQKGVSKAAIIRDCIDFYIRYSTTLNKTEKRRRALEVIGIGESGTGDIATRHNEYLVEIYAETGS